MLGADEVTEASGKLFPRNSLMTKIDPNDWLTAKRAFTTKELAEIALHLGWTYQRTKGSHQIFSMDGWREHLSIPVHKEYNWGVAKQILSKIIAPFRKEAPDIQNVVEKFQVAFFQLAEQANRRILEYETQKLDEIEALFKNESIPSLAIQDLEQRLQNAEDELCQTWQLFDTRKAEYEAKRDEEVKAFELKISSLNRELAEVKVLRQQRDRLRKSQRMERIIATTVIGFLGAIALSTFLTRPQCNPSSPTYNRRANVLPSSKLITPNTALPPQ
ncbi:MAG: addiction module toxin, HicA family [Acaryochloridaceae cyanobacterium RU_4_10]|nr:addiction module toxin, HicA family [Acaryochloridaceae cyanobacterium RU_4_10]